MKHLPFLLATAIAAAILSGDARADDGREAKPRFKGVEIYSWKDNTGDWRFALLTGTDDIKTEKQVKSAKDQVKGADNLKKALAGLAVGEQVCWVHRVPGFEFPPEATRKEIQKAAEGAKVNLRISEGK